MKREGALKISKREHCAFTHLQTPLFSSTTYWDNEPWKVDLISHSPPTVLIGMSHDQSLPPHSPHWYVPWSEPHSDTAGIEFPLSIPLPPKVATALVRLSKTQALPQGASVEPTNPPPHSHEIQVVHSTYNPMNLCIPVSCIDLQGLAVPGGRSYQCNLTAICGSETKEKCDPSTYYNGYVTTVVLQVRQRYLALFTPTIERSLPPGVELATSGFPSATTTNYAKEKLAFHWRGWLITYLRSEFHRYTSTTLAPFIDSLCFSHIWNLSLRG